MGGREPGAPILAKLAGSRIVPVQQWPRVTRRALAANCAHEKRRIRRAVAQCESGGASGGQGCEPWFGWKRLRRRTARTGARARRAPPCWHRPKRAALGGEVYRHLPLGTGGDSDQLAGAAIPRGHAGPVGLADNLHQPVAGLAPLGDEQDGVAPTRRGVAPPAPHSVAKQPCNHTLARRSSRLRGLSRQ